MDSVLGFSSQALAPRGHRPLTVLYGEQRRLRCVLWTLCDWTAPHGHRVFLLIITILLQCFCKIIHKWINIYRFVGSYCAHKAFCFFFTYSVPNGNIFASHVYFFIYETDQNNDMFLQVHNNILKLYYIFHMLNLIYLNIFMFIKWKFNKYQTVFIKVDTLLFFFFFT